MPNPFKGDPPIKGEVSINGAALDISVNHPSQPFSARGQSFQVQPNGQVSLSGQELQQFFAQQGM